MASAMVTQLMCVPVREAAGREREEKHMKPCLSHEANLTGSEMTEEENERRSSFEMLQSTSEQKYKKNFVY